MKRFLLLITFCLIVPVNYVKDALGAEFAKYAGEFLSTGVGARALGMGGAFVGIADDGTAGYWNPAGLSLIKNLQVVLMHSSRFAGEVAFDYMSASIPYKQHSSLGISLIRLGIDQIPDTRNALLDYGLDGIPDTGDFGEGNGELDAGERLDPNLINWFSNTDYAFFVSYARQRTERFSYGGNVKIIRRGIGENSAFGLGFDIGVLYSYSQRISFGVNVMDIPWTFIAWDTGRREYIAPTVKAGIAGTFSIPAIQGILKPAVDIDIRFENRKFASRLDIGRMSFDPRLGVEIEIRSKVFLRAGYDDIKRFTVGAGISLSVFHFDYSFSSFDNVEELGNTHRISLTANIPTRRFNRE